MTLLSRDTLFEDLPDTFWGFGSQFVICRGYDQEIDIDSLILLLWQMQKRIDELEYGVTNEPNTSRI